MEWVAHQKTAKAPQHYAKIWVTVFVNVLPLALTTVTATLHIPVLSSTKVIRTTLQFRAEMGNTFMMVFTDPTKLILANATTSRIDFLCIAGG